MRITDPSERQVFLPDNLCLKEGDERLPDLRIDEYQKVIETPACIIEISEEHLYYFRSVGWNFTVLIEVIKKENDWLAINCLKNPATDYIVSLLQGGRFIPGANMG